MSNLTITISTSAETQPATTDTFRFGESNIRIVTIDGEPWFAVADVCDVLGYANSRDTLAKHCRTPGVAKRDMGVVTGYKADGKPAIQQVSVTFINEGNLYRLIIKSRKPEAERFESWVCDEVLPTIRKTGSYTAAAVVQGAPLPEKISAAQVREIQERIFKVCRFAHMSRSAQYDVENALKYQLNTDSITKIRPSDYTAALNILAEMEKQTSDVYLELRIELDSQWYKILRGGTPDVREVKKSWQNRFNALLPAPINWGTLIGILNHTNTVH